MKLYSGTHGTPATTIIPLSTPTLPNGADNLFGGIFASNPETALSHGANLQEFDIDDDNILSFDDLRHELLYGSGALEVLKPAVEEIFGAITDDEAYDLAEFISDNKHLYRDDEFETGNDRLFSLLSVPGWVYAAWKIQGLAGEVARRMGYQAVWLPDEHGASCLIVSLS